MSERKMAYVAEITDLQPIDGRDRIVCATVNGGWKTVVNKGQFKVGDWCVYCEIDSFIPEEVAPFLTKGKKPKVFNAVSGNVLKTVRLGGQISQGLALEISTLPVEELNFLGEDVGGRLGIVKYEKPEFAVNGQMAGDFPGFIRKTDQNRIQNVIKDLVNNHLTEDFEISEKLEGSSMTVYYNQGFGVCSRNVEMQLGGGSTYTNVAEKLGLPSMWQDFCEYLQTPLAVQGELIGPGIQGNIYGLDKHEFRVFSLFNIRTGTPFFPYETRKIIELFNVNAQDGKALVLAPSQSFSKPFAKANDMLLNLGGRTNPEAVNQVSELLLEQLLELANGYSQLNPSVLREGLVFKSEESDFTFKVISNMYLEKN